MNFQDELPRLLDELADDHVVALPVIAGRHRSCPSPGDR
jgi:hypothetical protein